MVFLVTEVDVDTQDEVGSYDEEFTAMQSVNLGTKEYLRELVLPADTF
jgi:hypothetical protein